MPEQVYRVQGTDGYSGAPREVYVRGNSVGEAIRCAGQRGIIAPARHVEAMDEAAVPPGVVVIPARQTGDRPSALLTNPVWTIAQGVCVGLLLWTVCTFILWAVFAFISEFG